MKKLALLIGVGKYEAGLNQLPAALKDIEALKKVLNDPNLGEFDQVETLCDPDSQKMQYEIESFFSSCDKDDLALLFFSGHGIKDDRNRLHFAACNTSKNKTGHLILSTAVSASFVHDVMNRSKAKRQAVILDCCFSGAFDSTLRAKDDGSFDLKGQLGSEGRVVLASSSSTQYSFEQKEEELSIFTRYIVQGIETGIGDTNKDGRLSILELHEYVTKKVQETLPNVTPKIIVLKDKGFEIFLSKTKNNQEKEAHAAQEKVYLDKVVLENFQISTVAEAYSPTPSLLQAMNSFVERLIERLKIHYLSQTQSNKNLNFIALDYALEIIRLASDAKIVLSMRSLDNQNSWDIVAQSSLDSDGSATDYAKLIETQVLSGASTESIFTTGHHGIYRTFLNERTRIYELALLLPVGIADDEFMIVCGLPSNFAYLNDAYSVIVSNFYKAIKEDYSHPSRIEAYLLDELKRKYGFTPISFYDRRFELFCDRLSQMVIHFEPILDMRNVSIVAWEALARDPISLKAPVDLFDAAELWGRKFTVELDTRLLEQAAKSYREAASKAQMNRSNEISPLSVNVYPESLMRTVYFETVRRLTTEHESNDVILSADNLILEISEKSGLPTYQEGVRLQSPIQAFKERLVRYVQELEVRFSIDDFGVGYASVARLAGLNPPYVKIDRDILYQDQSETIIRFVKEMVAQSAKLHAAKIIVEGVDHDSPVSLKRLKQLGVHLVQGYVVGEDGPDIYRLTTERYKHLKDLIRGNSDEG